MPQNNIIGIKKPEAFVEDPSTEVLRNGAKKLLTEALEAEIESFLRQYKDLKDSKGRQRITANVAAGDGAPGFWKALEKAYASTRWQRCRVHKTANVLNKLSKSLQAKAKEKPHQIWVAPDKAEAGDHFDDFIEIYKAK